MNKQILFVSIDGMTDVLGQSQVLPYLTGLSMRGYKISIASCEKKQNFDKNERTVSQIAIKYNIDWNYCFYSTGIPLLSQIKNFFGLKKIVKENVAKNNNAVILHCRSYLPALIGLQLHQELKIKYIFDMRGFWANERIDGNIWNLKNPLYKVLYDYFKRKEIEMIENAACVVTLTKNAKQEIKTWQLKDLPNIEVIPCCADVDHFIITTDSAKNDIKKDLPFNKNSFVIGYLGSLGTWYMLNEMLDFFVQLQIKKPYSKFFFVTNDDKQTILDTAQRKNIDLNSIIIKSAKRSEVPAYISCFDLGFFLIKPLYSKKGSSPTKLAEILACGIPIVTNTGIGDVDELIESTSCGILISSFKKEEYDKVIDKIEMLNFSKQHYRDIALNNFSLQKGVEVYSKIYSDILL